MGSQPAFSGRRAAQISMFDLSRIGVRRDEHRYLSARSVPSRGCEGSPTAESSSTGRVEFTWRTAQRRVITSPSRNREKRVTANLNGSCESGTRAKARTLLLRSLLRMEGSRAKARTLHPQKRTASVPTSTSLTVARLDSRTSRLQRGRPLGDLQLADRCARKHLYRRRRKPLINCSQLT